MAPPNRHEGRHLYSWSTCPPAWDMLPRRIPLHRLVCQCVTHFTDICANAWSISQTCVPTCDWFHRHMCQCMTGWLVLTPLQSGQLKDFQISPVRRSHIHADHDSQATTTKLATCTDTRSHTQHAQVISCLCPKHKTRNSPRWVLNSRAITTSNLKSQKEGSFCQVAISDGIASASKSVLD